MFATLAMTVTLALGSAPRVPPKKTQLKLEITPATSVVYVDGKRRGTGGKLTRAFTVEPGRHTLKLVNGRDEHQESISVKKGESKVWQWAFEDDRLDQAEKKKAQGAEGAPANPVPDPSGGTEIESPPSTP